MGPEALGVMVGVLLPGAGVHLFFLPVCRRRGPRLRGKPLRVQEWGLWGLQRLLQQVRVCSRTGHGRLPSGCWGEWGSRPRGKGRSSTTYVCPFRSRSQGGGYGDRSSGGSYRDSYDSYGKSRSEGQRWELSKPSVSDTQTLSLCLPVRDETAFSGLAASSHFCHKTKAKPD